MRNMFLIVILLSLFVFEKCKAEQILETIAGNGNLVAEDDADFSDILQIPIAPGSVVADAFGNLVFCDFVTQRILAVSLTTGQPFNVGGSGVQGFAGDGGLARDAQFNTLGKLAIDADGNVIVSDTFNHRIRRIDVRTGIVTTIAGNGTAGFSGDGGLASAAQLNQPSAVVFDASGNMYIADTVNNRVRAVVPDGRIFTIAGNGGPGLTGEGGLAGDAEIGGPLDVTLDPQGNLIIASGFLRRVNAVTGIIDTIALGMDSQGRTLFLDSIAFSPLGELFAGSFLAGLVGRIDNTGIFNRVAGGGNLDDGAPATSTLLPSPGDIAFDPAGNLYIASFSGLQVKKLSSASVRVAQDNDRDGFSNSIETAAGTSPDDAASSPYGNQVHAYEFSSIEDVAFKLNFKTPGKDSVTVKGFFLEFFPLTEGMRIVVDFGGVAKLFTLNKRGKSVKSSPDSLAIKFVPMKKPGKKKGRTLDVFEFKLKLKRKDFVNALQDEGLVPNATSTDKRSILMTVLISENTTVYFERAFVSFTGKKGKGAGPGRQGFAGGGL